MKKEIKLTYAGEILHLTLEGSEETIKQFEKDMPIAGVFLPDNVGSERQFSIKYLKSKFFK